MIRTSDPQVRIRRFNHRAIMEDHFNQCLLSILNMKHLLTIYNPLETHNVVAMLIKSCVDYTLSTVSKEKTFLQYFHEILKRMLQNC